MQNLGIDSESARVNCLYPLWKWVVREVTFYLTFYIEIEVDNTNSGVSFNNDPLNSRVYVSDKGPKPLLIPCENSSRENWTT